MFGCGLRRDYRQSRSVGTYPPRRTAVLRKGIIIVRGRRESICVLSRSRLLSSFRKTRERECVFARGRERIDTGREEYTDYRRTGRRGSRSTEVDDVSNLWFYPKTNRVARDEP